jgi:hypothetical protein
MRASLARARSSAAATLTDVGRRLSGLRGEQRVVEFEQRLALLDLVVEIDVQPGDRAGNLRADADQDHRVERAVGRYRLREVAPFDGLQLVALFGRLATLWRYQ